MKKIYLTSVLMLLLLPMGGRTYALDGEEVIYQFDSAYHRIRVTQNGNIRALRFDNNFYQTTVDVTNPLRGHYDYAELFFDTALFKPDAENVCMLGLGGGSIQRLFNHFQPGLDDLTVEIDSAVVDVAEGYFFFDRNQMPVVVDDARRYLRSNQDKYDMIFQDSYTSNAYGTFVPFHLATYEYFLIVNDRLEDDGVFAINVIGTVYGGEEHRIITSIYKTMSEVFPQLYMFAADESQNVVIIATKDSQRLTRQDLLSRAQSIVNTRRSEFPQGFYQSAYKLYDTAPSGLSTALVLTDDYAPVDNLLR